MLKHFIDNDNAPYDIDLTYERLYELETYEILSRPRRECNSV